MFEWNGATTQQCLKIQLSSLSLSLSSVFSLSGSSFSSGGNHSQPLLCVVLHSRLEQLFNFILSIRDKKSAWKFINSWVTYASVLLIPSSIDVFFPMEWARLTPTPHPRSLRETAHCQAPHYATEMYEGHKWGIIMVQPSARECWDGCVPRPTCPGRLYAQPSPYTAWGLGRMYRPWPLRSCSVCKFKSLTSVAWLFDHAEKEKLRPLVS